MCIIHKLEIKMGFFLVERIEHENISIKVKLGVVGKVLFFTDPRGLKPSCHAAADMKMENKVIRSVAKLLHAPHHPLITLRASSGRTSTFGDTGPDLGEVLGDRSSPQSPTLVNLL